MERRDQFSEFDADAPTGSPEIVDPKAQPEEMDMVPKSRLDEVRAQRDQLHGQREEMIQSMLNSAPQQAAPAATESDAAEATKVVLPEGTDPEVAKLLTPILEANNKAVYDRVSEDLNRNVDTRVAPVEERINNAEMVESVQGRVEGFDTVRQDIVDMLERMSPEERKRYTSEIGLESLAHQALREREARTGARTDMAHSAPFGSSEARPDRREALESDVWALSDDEFERALARKGMSL